MRYSASKNSVTLKTGLGVVQGHWKWRRSLDLFNFLWHWIIVTLKSGLEVTQDHSNWYHSKAWVRFPMTYSPSIVTMTVFCIICEINEIFHSIPLVENRDFSYILAFLHSTPQLEWFPSEYCHPVWYGKTRMVVLPKVKKTCEDMYNRYV